MSGTQDYFLEDRKIEVNPLVTMAEICRILRCKPRFVYYELSRGRMPEPVKVGRRNRWRVEDIQGYIQRQAERQEVVQ